jgi:SMC interacting uncharacterized protein involved in chromosome segregation
VLDHWIRRPVPRQGGKQKVSEMTQRLHDELEKLKTHRDELRVQLDLGKMEARDAWHELEKKLHELESKMAELAHLDLEPVDDVGEAVEDAVEEAKIGLKVTASEIRDAATHLMSEIREGFQRLREHL